MDIPRINRVIYSLLLVYLYAALTECCDVLEEVYADVEIVFPPPGEDPLLPNHTCSWLVSLDTNNHDIIQLDWWHVNIPSSSAAHCEDAGISVYDGVDEHSPLIARYCNTNMPFPWCQGCDETRSTGRHLLLVLSSSNTNGNYHFTTYAFGVNEPLPGWAEWLIVAVLVITVLLVLTVMGACCKMPRDGKCTGQEAETQAVGEVNEMTTGYGRYAEPTGDSDVTVSPFGSDVSTNGLGNRGFSADDGEDGLDREPSAPALPPDGIPAYPFTTWEGLPPAEVNLTAPPPSYDEYMNYPMVQRPSE